MRWVVAALLIGCGCALGCGGSTARPRIEPEAVTPAAAVAGPMLYAGERFEVHASTSGVVLASLLFDVGAPCWLGQGRLGQDAVLPVRAQARRKGIASAFASGRVDSVSFLDANSRMPLRLEAHVENEKRSYDLATQWLSDGYRQSKHRVGRPPQEKTVTLPSEMLVYDPFSALGAMRTWAGNVGARDVMHVLIGRRLWRLDLHVVGRETVWSGDESRDAVRIDGTARSVITRKLRTGRTMRHWTLWVSDDEQRMPLKATLEARKQRMIEMSLVDYAFDDVDESGRAPCEKAR